MKKVIGFMSVVSLLFLLTACGAKAELKQVDAEGAVSVLDSKNGFLFYIYDHDGFEDYKVHLKNSVDKTDTTVNYFIDKDMNATGKDQVRDRDEKNAFEKRIKNTQVETLYIHAIKNGEVIDKLRVDDYFEGELSKELTDFINRNK